MASDRDGLDLPAAHVDEVEEQSRDKVRGEEARQEADEQRHPEALDGTAPEEHEDHRGAHDGQVRVDDRPQRDRKSTRLNSSHTVISYAVFCLKKKKIK